ncbi:hypothetical protein [Nevskia sp.]|uniref:hypothetical protein n=1 Tax=Nevskia sp. TaxID=1929292 RepID=UPI0025D7FFDA|nr:hypothetical protein [Nevskia sp.]
MNHRLKARFAAALLVATAAGSVASAAELYTRPGRYTIDAEGWDLQPGADGAMLLRCKACTVPVQVQIDYSPERTGSEAKGGNRAFLARLDTPEAQTQFAELMVEASLPDEIEVGEDIEIQIATVGKAMVGGLDVFQYVALIDGGEEVTQESSLVAIHHDRILKIALNHYQGALDDTARARIASLFKSLKFD